MLKNLAWALIGLNTGILTLGLVVGEYYIAINAVICGALAYASVVFFNRPDKDD